DPRRSPATGVGADRDRHRLCHDRAVPRRAAGGARPDRHRPRRRAGARPVTGWAEHLTIAPIVIPLVAGALMVLRGERPQAFRISVGLLSTVALLLVAILLVARADGDPGASHVHVYRLGNWPASFGIVLVLDRLAALMLLLTAVLGMAAYTFALARWHKAGAHFHALFQFQ